MTNMRERYGLISRCCVSVLGGGRDRLSRAKSISAITNCHAASKPRQHAVPSSSKLVRVSTCLCDLEVSSVSEQEAVIEHGRQSWQVGFGELLMYPDVLGCKLPLNPGYISRGSSLVLRSCIAQAGVKNSIWEPRAWFTLASQRRVKHRS